MRWLFLAALVARAGGSRIYTLSHGSPCVDDFDDATDAECYNFFVEYLAGNTSYSVPWVRSGFDACVMDNLQLRSGSSAECATARYCVCIHNPDSGSGEEEEGCTTFGTPDEWPAGLHALVWSLTGLLTIAVATIVVLCCRQRQSHVISVVPTVREEHTVTETWEVTKPAWAEKHIVTEIVEEKPVEWAF